MDDRTDDCAFGAMMSLALRPKFRTLRFQMIDDTRPHGILFAFDQMLVRVRLSELELMDLRVR